MNVSSKLPAGVRLQPITRHDDARGSFSEIFRSEGSAGIDPIQWNVVSSEAGVLRGVHVHVRHDDYVVVVHGSATIGLRDLRPWSPTHGSTALVELRRERLGGLTIPWGVAHGFYHREPSIFVLGVSEYFDPEDELGCRWDDPRLGIPWPVSEAQLSRRDEEAPPFGRLVQQLADFPAFCEAARER